MSTFILTNECLFCAGYRLPLFRPSRQFEELRKYDPYWNQKTYILTTHTSGKQTKTYERIADALRAAGIDLQKLVAHEREDIAAITKKQPTVSDAIIARMAKDHRVCQRERWTVQIHYGTKPSHTQGCLLVSGPSYSYYAKKYPGFIAEHAWDFASYLTQVRLHILLFLED